MDGRFSLALVTSEILTHKTPLEGDDLVQLGFASANPTRRPTPRTLGATVPDAVEAVFLKALAVAPDQRFQSAGEFWNALRVAVNLTPLRSASPSITDAAHAFSGASTLAVPSSGAPPMSAPISVKVVGSQPAVPSVPSMPTPMTQTPVVVSTAPGGSGRTALVVGVIAVAIAAGAGISFTIIKSRATTGVVPSASIASASVSVAAPPPACPVGMIRIEGGEFFMGSSDPRALDNEKPAHSVTLSPYCIDKTEVTVEAYKACSEGGKCKVAGKENYFGGFDNLKPEARSVLNGVCNINEPSAKATHPINCVDWEMAANFCARKAPGGALPTEAQWEYAARGPDGRAYPWGDDPPSARFLNGCGTECTAWGKKNHLENIVTFGAMYNEDDKFPTTSPVGSFPDGRSRYGLDDVDGNVWEWTSDFFAEYTKDAQKDPTGPKAGDEGRVARGGAFNGSNVSWVRPTFRFHFAPTNRSYGVGFRCAAPIFATVTPSHPPLAPIPSP